MINEILNYIEKNSIISINEIEKNFGIDKYFIEYLIKYTNYYIDGKFIFYKKQENVKCSHCIY